MMNLRSCFCFLDHHSQTSPWGCGDTVIPHHIGVGSFVKGEIESAEEVRKGKIELCVCQAV